MSYSNDMPFVDILTEQLDDLFNDEPWLQEFPIWLHFYNNDHDNFFIQNPVSHYHFPRVSAEWTSRNKTSWTQER